MKKHLLMKTLLVALVCLVGGTSSVWATDVPAPVYFNDFSSTDGLTIKGTGTVGSFTTEADTRFGQVFSNAASASPRTNYLLLPTTVFSAFTDEGGKTAMTISFWVNAKNAGAANAYTYAPLFAAYSAAPNPNNGSPMICLQSRGFMQINNNGWCNFDPAQNKDGKNNVYNTNAWEAGDDNYISGGNWLDDSNWHLYTMTLTTSQATIYLDGVLKNQWNLDGSDGQYVSGMFTKSAANLTYVCLGGNQAWDWGDNDAAFMFDDFAVYDVALSAEQIAQIIADKNAVPSITAIPVTYDFSTLSPSVSPFNNCTWVKGTNVNAIRFAGANSVTGTAYFDSDAGEDGNQPYTISSNETVTLTINAFHSWMSASREATVSIKNSAGVELASYKYNPNPSGTNVGKIMDVKIGGTSVTPFVAFDFRSMNTNSAGANGLASSSKPYVAAAANHPVISISIKGDGNVKLKFTRTLAGAVVNQEFSGTLGGDVAKNMASIVVADGITDADRAYAIQKLTITSEYSYSVTAIDKDDADLFEITSGSAPEGDNVTVPFNKYYKVGNSLLQANAIDDSNKQFSYTFGITASANEKTITYNTTSLNNVMFYSEGEDLTGVNVVEAGHIVLRGSGQKGGAGTDIAVTTLPAGKYKITACFGGKSSQTYTVKVGTDAVISETSESTLKTVTSSEIVLTESKDVTFSGGYATSNGSNAHGLDYIYIQNLTDQNATLNSAGLASFSSAYPLDLSGISGATAYYAKNEGLSAGKVTLTAATGSVAAGEGLILKGENGADVTIPVAATGTAITGNLMVGCPTGEDITSSTIDNANIYVLGASDAQLHNVATYVLSNTLSIPAGKAYLKASIPSGARSLTISFDDDDVTGVNEVRSQKEDVRSEWFDLQGRKVAQPAKGLYIVNGRKVVVK